jgi:hypothetical protein
MSTWEPKYLTEAEAGQEVVWFKCFKRSTRKNCGKVLSVEGGIATIRRDTGGKVQVPVAELIRKEDDHPNSLFLVHFGGDVMKSQTMKLSEAIREGAKIRQMAKGAFYTQAWRSGDVRSCALGAAHESILPCTTNAHPVSVRETLEEKWQFLKQSWDNDRSGFPIDWIDVIAEMNDSGRYTREEIADWLESIGL